eukprot:9322767-Pyramimonas_sp.AAC.1
MLAGHVIAVARYGAMSEALSAGNSDRAFKLFEAALSVPIRLRLCPGPGTCQLLALAQSEAMLFASAASGADSFWKLEEKVSRLSKCRRALAERLSLPRLMGAPKGYGLTFMGKP